MATEFIRHTDGDFGMVADVYFTDIRFTDRETVHQLRMPTEVFEKMVVAFLDFMETS